MKLYSVHPFRTGSSHRVMSSSFIHILPSVRMSFPRQKKVAFALSFALILWFLNKQKQRSSQLFIFHNKSYLEPQYVEHTKQALWLSKVKGGTLGRSSRGAWQGFCACCTCVSQRGGDSLVHGRLPAKALGAWAPSCLLCFPPNHLLLPLGPSQDPRT